MFVQQPSEETADRDKRLQNEDHDPEGEQKSDQQAYGRDGSRHGQGRLPDVDLAENGKQRAHVRQDQPGLRDHHEGGENQQRKQAAVD
jgi:hypothetical protein